jgi:hypothetical protein
MHRYYVSFSFEGPTSGLSIASLDVSTPDPIVTVDDLQSVYDLLAQQGYTINVKVLAFSRYANPHQGTQPARRSNRGRSS